MQTDIFARSALTPNPTISRSSRFQETNIQKRDLNITFLQNDMVFSSFSFSLQQQQQQLWLLRRLLWHTHKRRCMRMILKMNYHFLCFVLNGVQFNFSHCIECSRVNKLFTNSQREILVTCMHKTWEKLYLKRLAIVSWYSSLSLNGKS